MSAYWGIDLGGTKIEAVVLETLDPKDTVSRQRLPTEAHMGYDHILDQIARLIDKVSKESGYQPGTIGIGTPGVHDKHTLTLKNSNTTVLNGKPFKQDLEKKLGIPLILANDANCFALAETHMGAVKDHVPDAEVVFGIIIGTGVGGGIVINGKVLNGHQGIAGEWGHSYLDESGGPCYCGNIGCVETLIAGPSLQRFYHGISGQDRILKDIVTRLGEDKYARATLDRLHHFFGKGVANLIDILDPDVIVIGGGVGNIDSIYTEGVRWVEKYVFNFRLDTVFLKPKLGDSAGVFGAAALTL